MPKYISIGTIRIKDGVEQIRKISNNKWGYWVMTDSENNKKIMKQKLSETNKGENNGFYGKKHSSETIDKIRQKHLGKKVSEKTRQLMSDKHKGKKQTIEWIKKRADSKRIYLFDKLAIDRKGKARVRASIEYKEWRKAVFERDNFTCQQCGQIGGYLEAHHKKSYTYYPELRFIVSNGITLCIKCHRIKNKKQMVGNKNAIK